LVFSLLSFACVLPAPLALAYSAWIRRKMQQQGVVKAPRRLLASAVISGLMTAVFFGAMMPLSGLGVLVLFGLPVVLTVLWRKFSQVPDGTAAKQ